MTIDSEGNMIPDIGRGKIAPDIRMSNPMKPKKLTQEEIDRYSAQESGQTLEGYRKTEFIYRKLRNREISIHDIKDSWVNYYDDNYGIKDAN